MREHCKNIFRPRSMVNVFVLGAILLAVSVPAALASSNIQMTSTASASTVSPGQSVTISTQVTAIQSASNMMIYFSLYSSSGAYLGAQSYSNLNFAANQPVSKTFSWTVPAKTANGKYSVHVDLWQLTSSGSLSANVGGNVISFTVASTATNGVCGSSNSTALSGAPATSTLCTTGTASSVKGTGPWTWSCTGLNGGKTASCSASLAMLKPCVDANGTSHPSSSTPYRGVVCRSGLAHGKPFIRVSAVGPKAAYGRIFSNTWPQMLITNKDALSKIISMIANSYDLFESSKTDERRSLLGFVFLNLKLEGPTLRYDLRKPFEQFAKLPNNPEWRAGLDESVYSGFRINDAIRCNKVGHGFVLAA